MENTQETEKLNSDFFYEFLNRCNSLALGGSQEEHQEFNQFVSENKDRINSFDYLSIFSEYVKIFNIEFYKQNFETCKIFFEYMKNNEEWKTSDLGLRNYIRLKSFVDSFEKYLNKKQ